MPPHLAVPQLLAVPPELHPPSTRAPQPAAVSLARFTLLLDPDHFGDVAFFRELDAMGYEQVLLGGTGSHRLPGLVADIRRSTRLAVVVYPSGPDAVCEADLLVLPDIMNSRAPHARPFGPGAVMTALAVARTGCPWLAVAHFIQGQSTARWFYDAEPIREPGLLANHCRYADMIGYRHIALDYEDPTTQADPSSIARVKASAPRCHLTVSDEVSPAGAHELLQHGADTVVLPSNVLQETVDPLALAHRYHARLLA